VQKKNFLSRPNLSIEASFIDQENDTIDCHLSFNNTQTQMEPSNNKGKNLFMWDLSNYIAENQNFNLVASDGESDEQIGPFEIRTFWITEYEKYTKTIIVIIGALGAMGFRGQLSPLFDRVQKLRKKGRGHERLKRYYERRN
jgi:hypothetical protein